MEEAMRRALEDHRDKHDLEPGAYTSYWYARPTHNRDLPYFAFATVTAGCYTPLGALDIVEDAWVQPEWPEANYGTPMWRTMFQQVGYLHLDEDGQPQPRPEVVPTLWRGAIPSRRKGMAWTSDRERAEWFVRRWQPGGSFRKASLWRLDDVPADRVFARFDGRGEHEWALDTRGLTPVRV
jgi:hypothetical protein